MSTKKTGADYPAVKTIEEVVAEHVDAVLSLYGFNLTQTAKALGISIRTLQRRVDNQALLRFRKRRFPGP